MTPVTPSSVCDPFKRKDGETPSDYLKRMHEMRDAKGEKK